MLARIRFALLLLGLAVLLAGPVQAAGPADSLKQGTPELQSIGALTFGPEGILFLADPRAAAIIALDTGDRAAAGAGRPKVEAVDEKVASLLGVEAKQLEFNDLAVNPLSGNTYLSVTRGKGPDGKPVLLRVERSGKIAAVPLKDVKYARTTLPNPATGDRQRQDVITHMAYVKGRLLVAGLSNEEFSSKFRSLPFPFTEADKGTGVEIFHGSHGRIETKSPIRTFVPYDINGETNLLAAYTCTPLVKVPVADLKPGTNVKGTTVAELGSGNRPLDMVVYQKGGKNYLLLAKVRMREKRRDVLKVPIEGIDKIEAITKPVRGTAGLKYETIKDLEGTQHLNVFDKDHILVLRKTKENKLDLETAEMP